MQITNSMRALVAQALRDREMSNAELAKELGVHRSWPTRFFDEKKGIKTLSTDMLFGLKDTLGIQFFTAVSTNPNSDLASKLDALMEKDSRVAKALASLVSSLQDDHYYDLPMLPTKDLVDFGNEIMRAPMKIPTSRVK